MVGHSMRAGTIVTAAWAILTIAAGCGGETTESGAGSTGADPSASQPLSISFCGGQQDRQCEEGSVCVPILSQGCLEPGQVGLCIRRPSYCLPISNPMCGCDGVSYPNICETVKGGTAVDHSGLCEEPEGPVCGGAGGPVCAGEGTCIDDEGMACDRTDEECTGTCTCKVVKKCAPREVWDLDPEVCGCIPAPADACDNVECPNPERTQCVVNDDGTTSCEEIGDK